MKNKIIKVENISIGISQIKREDYICITDMAGVKENKTRVSDVIKNWLRNRTTLEFLDTWEMLYNPEFKVVEFDHFKKHAGLHTFEFVVELVIRDSPIFV